MPWGFFEINSFFIKMQLFANLFAKDGLMLWKKPADGEPDLYAVSARVPAGIHDEELDKRGGNVTMRKPEESLLCSL